MSSHGKKLLGFEAPLEVWSCAQAQIKSSQLFMNVVAQLPSQIFGWKTDDKIKFERLTLPSILPSLLPVELKLWEVKVVKTRCESKQRLKQNKNTRNTSLKTWYPQKNK